MQAMAYLGYTVLILFALVWTLGVRTKLGIERSTMTVGLFFTVAAVMLPMTGTPLIHSWWLIPAGYIFGWVAGKIEAWRTPVLNPVLQVVTGTYAGVIRVGIPAETIQLARRAAWDEFLTKKQSDGRKDDAMQKYFSAFQKCQELGGSTPEAFRAALASVRPLTPFSELTAEQWEKVVSAYALFEDAETPSVLIGHVAETGNSSYLLEPYISRLASKASSS